MLSLPKQINNKKLQVWNIDTLDASKDKLHD